MGILFAFLALMFWGLGDFLIQKSSREFGDSTALFYISAFASIVLLPFVWGDLGNLGLAAVLILLVISVVETAAAFFDFEALREGKISVVEPVFALEVPVTVILATAVLGEWLTPYQFLLILLMFLGIFLVSNKSLSGFKKIRLEKGVFYAICATFLMGGVNFLFGYGSRETSPLLVNWFTSLFITLVVLIYLLSRRRIGEVRRGWSRDKKLALSVGFIDNAAWVAFSYSALFIPIAIATSISESYIALAVILGLLISKERLNKHQYVGLTITIISVIALTATV